MPSLQDGEYIIDGMVDPWDASQNTIYVLTNWRIFKTPNLKQTSINWIPVRDIRNEFAANLSPTFSRIRATIAIKNRVYVLAYAKPSSGSVIYNQYCYVTSDGGSSWTRYATGGIGGGSSSFEFTADLEGWAVNTDRSIPIVGEITYYGVMGTVQWNSTDGRTSPGCMQMNVPGVGGGYISQPESACVASYSINHVVSTGELAIDMYWNHNVGNFSPELLMRVKFDDDTVQDYIANVGGGGGGWINWQLAISAGNNGKTAVEATIGFCNTGLDWFYTQNFLFDDIQIFGSGSATPIVNSFDAGQHNGNIVYAGTGTSIRRSTNGGSTWAEYISGAGAHDIECHYAGNPTDANLTFWGTNGSLYRSNGAIKGSPIDTEAFAANQHRRTQVYVLDASVIYTLNCTAEGVYKIRRTTNAGSSWDDGQTGIPNASMIGLWPFGVHNAATQRLYVFGDNVYYSVDGGDTLVDKSWSGFSSGGGRMYVPLWLTN